MCCSKPCVKMRGMDPIQREKDRKNRDPRETNFQAAYLKNLPYIGFRPLICVCFEPYLLKRTGLC